MSSRKSQGFSLIELLIVIGVIMVMASFATMLLQPALRQQHVANAYNETLSTLRLARQMAVARRNIYQVTFNNAVTPNTITITDNDPVNPRIVQTTTLPPDVSFDAEPGIPSTVATTPDNFGAGAPAIAFDQNIIPNIPNVIFFYPDGSAQDAGNNLNNGVVYIARPGLVNSSQAITLWGATGRLRGWRLVKNGGVNQWVQQ